ncbi:hypothetical protein NLJ89_g2451 [Agrocybe chaxingu]|uniref:F-box domain-containing protein n=1 Tax=Agrocybe chaxingu TaxID=84603 RepID=A0A9W8MYV9_9AGAR|nr:hypothetical protein NLJ89_g2451 [Agrocybe chaxingu]
MSISDLSPELFKIIGDCLEINDARNARLACKQIGEYLEPQILSSLVICCTGHNLVEKQLLRIESLARGEYPAIVRSVRSLSIGPWFLKEKPGPELDLSPSGSCGSPDTVLNNRVSQFLKTLSKALLCLTGVTSVRWIRSARDPMCITSSVADALQAFPRLRRLSFVQYTETNLEALGNVTSGLNELPDLEEIGVQIDTNSEYDSEMLRYFAKVLVASPNLESLSIVNTRRRADSIPNSSVHQLFEQCSPSNPVHLKKLSLSNMLVNLAGSILPHFRHLVSLHLVRIFEPGVTDKMYGRRFRPEHLLETASTGSTLDHTWTALSSIKVCLQEITVDNIGNGFIDYVSAYSGLKKLDIRSPWYPDAATRIILELDFLLKGNGALVLTTSRFSVNAAD